MKKTKFGFGTDKKGLSNFSIALQTIEQEFMNGFCREYLSDFQMGPFLSEYDGLLVPLSTAALIGEKLESYLFKELSHRVRVTVKGGTRHGETR